MSDAQIVLAFVFGAQPTTLDDKKTALALAKECAPEANRIAEAIGKTQGSDGKSARAGHDDAALATSSISQPNPAGGDYPRLLACHLMSVLK